MRRTVLSTIAVSVLVCSFAGAAGGMTLLFTAEGWNSTTGQNLSASAVFDDVTTPGSLTVTLSNIGADVLAPSDILTALFFDLAGDPVLTPVSAVMPTGSTVLWGNNGGGNVGGEWAYLAGLTGAPRGAREGISSSGFGLFGYPNFNGPNLDDPETVDGMNFGLLSQIDDTGSGNAAVTGANPLIKHTVVFTLSGLAADGLQGVENVGFQYGTSLVDPLLPPIPEPSSLLLLGSGLIGLGGVLWRRRR